MIDVLTDVLEATRTGGVVFARVKFRAPWGLRCDPAPLAGFHIVARGSCSIRLDASPDTVELQAGDIALITQGGGHALYDKPDSPATPLQELIATMDPGEIGHLDRGAGGAETVLVCGGYLFEAPGRHPLLSALPAVIHVRNDQMSIQTRLVLDQILSEVAEQPNGSKTVINRLVDVLLVYMLRTWMSEQSPERMGWLAGLREPAIGQALQRIHADYSQELTLSQLARYCGMSLSTFKKRFVELVGETPGSYLTRLRLDRACGLLRDTDQPVSEIANAVGYASEFAFNRAFTRGRGVSPGRYRRKIRSDPPVSPVVPAQAKP